MFSPVFAGDCFSGNFVAFLEDFFFPRVTWVHPCSPLLLGRPSISVHCVFVVTEEVAGIVAFEAGLVFVVVVVVTVVDSDDAITVVLLLLVVF